MASTVNIYLPLNTYVSVYGYTNAAYMQQVTVVEESGTQHTMTGVGENNTPMQGGTFAIRTPSSSQNPAQGYRVAVTVQSQQGGWKPSNVTSGKVSLLYFNLAMALSEDSTDQDWNDSMVQFCWWSPPV